MKFLIPLTSSDLFSFFPFLPQSLRRRIPGHTSVETACNYEEKQDLYYVYANVPVGLTLCLLWNRTRH